VGGAEAFDSAWSPDSGSRELGDPELWDAVHGLPARQRSAVVLRFVGDLRHREIAEAIGCSEEAARRSLHEGLKTLRKAVAA
jgi:RNA polymerase sigma factor (sigma-70 family)